MPFFAEEMYQKLRRKEMPESIHLFDWPKADQKQIDEKLEEAMVKEREIVTLALAERAKVGIKVRQPLQQLIINNEQLVKDKELSGLIKDEVNVKEITFGKELKLVTEITPELKEEGMVREIIRNIQGLRKTANLKPADKIFVYYSTGEILKSILVKNKDFILMEAKIKDLIQTDVLESAKIIEIDQEKLSLMIQKV